MLLTIRPALTQAMHHFQADRAALARLAPSIELNRKGLAQLSEWLARHPDPTHVVGTDWQAKGVPTDIAQRVGHFPTLVAALELVGLAVTHKMRVDELAEVFFGLEKRLEMGWLGKLATQAAQTPWQRVAIAGALAELASNHRRLTAQLANKNAKGKRQTVAQWAAAQGAKLGGYDALLAEWRAAGTVDLAMLMLANERLSALSA